MTKTDFLRMLSTNLCHLPKEQSEKAILYYSGIIDGRMEGGMTEEKAVELCGAPEKVALDYTQSTYIEDVEIKPISRLSRMPYGLRAVLSALLTLLCVCLIIASWGVAASVIAVAVSLAIVSIVGIFGGMFMCFFQAVPVGLCFVGIGIIIASILLFIYMPLKSIIKIFTSATSYLTKKMRSLFATEVM